MALALSGLTVVDVSQGLPGPLCAMLLADLGADVIKVEPPGGDWMRDVGPFVNGESSLFIRLNRGKEGVCLDLKNDAGIQAFLDLIRSADILVEGYRSGVMARLGLAYDDVAAINPGLVYCSISGHGSAGPLADEPATELDIQATVGSWRRLGVRSEAPLRVGFDILSTVAGWAALQSVLVGLFAREETGEGQHVETSLMHAGVALQSQNFIAESNPDLWKKDTLTGYLRAPERGYRCKDAYFLLDTLVEQEQWVRFCQAIGADDVLADPRFATAHLRQDHRDDLAPAVSVHLTSWAFADVADLIRAGGGSIVRMEDAQSLFADPAGQVSALGILEQLVHPVAGTYGTFRVPWVFSEPITRLTESPAPAVGEHTEVVFARLAYDESQLSELSGMRRPHQSELPEGVGVAQ